MSQGIRIGSPEHKELFCRVFIDTHDPYDPQKIDWPDIDAATREQLAALPFWNEAVSTESDVANKVQALAPLERDPLIRDAIALQGYEEGRHAALLRIMTSHYGINVAARGPEPFKDAEWAFIRTGYGECFDSFFSFGLFRIAQDAGFFPASLIKFFEPIVQEEARHILFFVNWMAWRRLNHALLQRVRDVGQTCTAMAMQIWARIQTIRGVQTDDFMLNSRDSMNVDITPRGFLELCLQENERRLSGYDARLLRPRFVPTVARLALKFLPKG